MRRSTFTDVGNGKISFGGTDNTILADSFEKHLRSRKGFLGVSQAIYGVFEPQGRGALHMHAPVWTLVNAELIARCTTRQLELLCVAINRVIATWIHENDVRDEEKKKRL